MDRNASAVNPDPDSTEVEVVEEDGSVVADDPVGEVEVEFAAGDGVLIEHELELELELDPGEVREVLGVEVDVDAEEDDLLEVNLLRLEEDTELFGRGTGGWGGVGTVARIVVTLVERRRRFWKARGQRAVIPQFHSIPLLTKCNYYNIDPIGNY